MKKKIVYALTAAMMIGAIYCGSSTAVSASTEAAKPASGAEQAASSAETAADGQTEENVYRNPLTGEITETDISNKRPIIAMLNSIHQALPQSGNSSADMLFEVPEEGGITRVMAVYQDPTDVGNIGTIRSTRQYYVYLTMGLDGLMAHAGTGIYAQEVLDNEDYFTLDFMKISSIYWRDDWRKNNIATEHSLYTSSENIQEYLDSHEDIRTEHEEEFVSPYTFTEDATPAEGEDANRIEVTFSDYKKTEFDYDKESGEYLVSFFDDEPYMDENTDTQVSVKNVIVLPTVQEDQDDGQHQKFDLSEGIAYFACNGKYEQISWHKGEMYDPLVFTKADGSQLDLNVGQTYVCILDDDQPISFS